MTIAFRSADTGGNSSGTDVTVTKPSGTADNDILVAVTYREGGAWTLPDGWAWLITDYSNFNANAWIAVAWKRASGEGANYVFQMSTTTYRTVAIGAFSGATTSGNPFDASRASAADAFVQLDFLSITLGVANEMAICLTGNYSGDNPDAGTSTYTVATNGMLGGCGIAYKLFTSSGATGDNALHRSGGTNGDWVSHHVALIPAGTYSSSVSPSVSPSISSSVSSSLSQSSSVSASVSPSAPALITGSTCWGHITGVTETNVRTFASNWTGTGAIENSGDTERLALETTEYMESEVVITGASTVTLQKNNYAAGDNVLVRYRHGTTEANCLAASWNNYSTPFTSLGYVQLRVESTL